MSTDNIGDSTRGKEDISLPIGPITIDAVFLSVSTPPFGYFFLEEGPDNYSLFRPGPKPDDPPRRVAHNIANGETFRIEGGLQLTVHFFTDEKTQQKKARGSWQKPDSQEDGGTYTAQAGGGVPTTASASA